MPANPKAQLTRLTLGIVGVAAVAGVAGKLAAGPARVDAATGPANTAITQEPAAPQSFLNWFAHDDDDEDDDEHEAYEHAQKEAGKREHGQRNFQFAQPRSGGTGSATSPGTQQPLPRSRSKHS